MSSSSAFDARPFVPREVMSRVLSALSPMLASRSFAPKAVRIRITKMAPAEPRPTLVKVGSLNKIADLYNDYRLGIFVNTPDLSHIDVGGQSVFAADIEGDVKTASDSVSLSNLMMKLAYWPGLTLGLHSSAEENYSEEAVTPETQSGEHYVAP